MLSGTFPDDRQKNHMVKIHLKSEAETRCLHRIFDNLELRSSCILAFYNGFFVLLFLHIGDFLKRSDIRDYSLFARVTAINQFTEIFEKGWLW